MNTIKKGDWGMYTFKNRSYVIVSRPAVVVEVDIPLPGKISILTLLNGTKDFEVFGNTLYKDLVDVSPTLQDGFFTPAGVAVEPVVEVVVEPVVEVVVEPVVEVVVEPVNKNTNGTVGGSQ